MEYSNTEEVDEQVQKIRKPHGDRSKKVNTKSFKARISKKY